MADDACPCCGNYAGTQRWHKVHGSMKTTIDPRLVAALHEATRMRVVYHPEREQEYASSIEEPSPQDKAAVFLADDRVRDWLAERLIDDYVAFVVDEDGTVDFTAWADAILGREK